VEEFLAFIRVSRHLCSLGFIIVLLTANVRAQSTATASDSSPSNPLQVTGPTFVTEQAAQAASFIESVGVETHLTYLNTPFASQWPTILGELKSLGVHHVRDGYYAWDSSSSIVINHQSLAAAGISTTYVIPLDFSTTPEQIQATAAKVTDMEAIEAPNECDVDPACGGPGLVGINRVVSFLPTLHAAGQLLHLPVIGAVFTTAEAYLAAGNIASNVDYNDLHVYFGGRNPGSTGWGDGDSNGNNYGSFGWWIDQANVDAPNAPVIITETGYYAVPNPAPYQVTEAVSETYIPRTYLLAFNHGVTRTFLHELLDEVASPNFGLLRSDLSERPAYRAVKNMLGTLADPGGAFAPGHLTYAISGADPTLNHTLLQKRDGSFWLVLWLEQSSYNPATTATIPVVPQSVVLTVGNGGIARNVTQLNGNGDANSYAVDGSSGSIPLNITDQLTMVQITQ
jgi:hypothetical protein